MSQQDNILEELNHISPLLLGINKHNILKVPNGYFDLVSSEILSQILDLKATEQLTAPKNYFESLPEIILGRIKKESAEETTSYLTTPLETLSKIGNKNVFRVPEGYFEALSDNFSVPSIELSDNEVLNETAKLSETVSKIGKTNVFRTPEGYFNSFEEKLSRQRAQTSKLFSLSKWTTPYRYLAAASVIGIAGLIGFLLLFNFNSMQSGANMAANMKKANQIIRTNSLENEIASLSDEAIVEFLENKGQNVEASLLASLDDEKSLPSADDYLTKENALENVLKSLELNN